MRIVRRVSGAIAISFALTGCAVATHTPVAIATFSLPTCDKTLLELSHLSTSLNTKVRIIQATSGPMRICKYRWDNGENKLALVADFTRSPAPVALLHTLSKLKTVYEVYGPNAVFPCPTMQGNADVLILRTPTGPATTVIQVQRDGCGRVIVTHPGSVTYIAYLGTESLLTQLDAINATPSKATKYIPKIRVTPSTNLRDGELLLVQVFGAYPGESFRISECATAAAANVNGCGEQLAAQRFIDTDPLGTGSTEFNVQTKAATRPYNTKAFLPCTIRCVIMATGTDVRGRASVVYAPIKFSI